MDKQQGKNEHMLFPKLWLRGSSSLATGSNRILISQIFRISSINLYDLLI